MASCRLDRFLGHNYVARGFGGVRPADFRLPIGSCRTDSSTVRKGQSRSDGAAEINQNRDSDLDARRKRLSKALEGRHEKDRVHEAKSSGAGGFAKALKIGSEFVAGVLVGAALGWGLDSVAGTSPWGLIVFMMLGFAAGILNVIRSSSSMNTSAGEAEKDQ